MLLGISFFARAVANYRVAAGLGLAALAAWVIPAQAQYQETVVHYFEAPPKGDGVLSAVMRDSSGNLYGTAPAGGIWNAGVVYKIDPSGHQTVLHQFTGGADGGVPSAGVVADSTGNLYGTTYSGGAYGYGTVYKLSSGGQETVLYSFTGGPDGSNPQAGLVLGSAGDLYGTAPLGGLNGNGVVYSVDTTGHETVLYSFTGGADGSGPQAALIFDGAGNLYGTTELGGAYRHGVVYKLDTSGHETILHAFTGGADGGEPLSSLCPGPGGALYGTAPSSGPNGMGVVYRLDPTGETVLYTFQGNADGSEPSSGLVRDSAGNLYGTTAFGGIAGGGGPQNGVVYKVDPSGGETVIYSFTGGSDGRSPFSGVILDSLGNLYGTALAGGQNGPGGVVYTLNPAGQQTVIYSFPGSIAGTYPQAGLTRDPAGNFYGTARNGGASGNGGLVYKLDTSGRETVLHNFACGADGCAPTSAVTLDSSGNLYGTTASGGPADGGVVYKFSAAGEETVLHGFTGGSDGFEPTASVILDAAGNIYGTTSSGGTYNKGTIFELSPAGQETILYNFTDAGDGGEPLGALLRDSKGNLYGTTCAGGAFHNGIVFKLDSNGNETVIFAFVNYSLPSGRLVQDSAGNLYGTTQQGGANGSGAVFKISPTGQETTLYSFNDYGISDLILDPAGNLYGTIELGGTHSAGAVFMISPAGEETVLYSFTGLADGAAPLGGVIRDAAGSLWGTASGGGIGSNGVIFKLTP